MDAYTSIKRAILDRNFTPIYFLMGDEPFFIDQLSQLLIETVLPEEQRDFNQTILYGKETSIEDIVSVCKRFPMMSEFQVIIVKEAQDLSRQIEQLNSFCLCLFILFKTRKSNLVLIPNFISALISLKVLNSVIKLF